MAGNVDHVIDTPGDPVVTIGIAAGTVAGEVIAGHRLEVGVDHALMIAIDTTDLPGPAGLDHQQTGTGAFDELALFVQQHWLYAEHGLGGTAGLERLRAGQRGEHDAAGFGLPPGIDDGAALLPDFLEIPLPGFGVDRLADAAQQAQALA
ncbi:hypothetical protein D3C79_667410 [compost metagenome]